MKLGVTGTGKELPYSRLVCWLVFVGKTTATVITSPLFVSCICVPVRQRLMCWPANEGDTHLSTLTFPGPLLLTVCIYTRNV